VTVNPINLHASFLRLHHGGRVSAVQQRFDTDEDDWRLMTFHVETDSEVHADHWEHHPEADEAVLCLTGAVRLYLRSQHGEAEDEIKLDAGTAVVVPRGRWHRIALDGPSDIMSITCPRGSKLKKRAEL
jgi:quercetin dioxygenase-like cupin family protein